MQVMPLSALFILPMILFWKVIVSVVLAITFFFFRRLDKRDGPR